MNEQEEIESRHICIYDKYSGYIWKERMTSQVVVAVQDTDISLIFW